ncbi:MAG: prepilin peptidase [Verrucomicrobia bacterium]|nr:prepilin peptidase [Verrucomicrobiota bacterium]
MFDPEVWALVPFHFWSVAVLWLGLLVGSFLNVCIYRMPRDESIVSPPSHCPHCGYSIPWYLNVPLITWLYLRGKCANCRAPISFRYFLVELLTGLLFLAAWLSFGAQSPALALVYCLILAGFVVATFIDFEHFIIPDEITLGGMAAGFVASFLVPGLHGVQNVPDALKQSFLGMAVGGGVIYAILRLGKLLFGKQKLALEPGTRILFTETVIKLPAGEMPYEEFFYRKSDTIFFEASHVEMIDRCYRNVSVRLSPELLRIGEDEFNPEQTPYMEVITDQITVPREAMGFGDVKFMAAIGAFLGWQATLFSLMVSSIIGAVVGVSFIAMGKREWSSRIPYGPYIALAAVIWMFWGYRWFAL